MKTVLVTGSTDGIGMATACRLFLAGHKVLVHGRTEERSAFAHRQICIYAGMAESSKQDRLINVWGDFTKMKEVVELSRQVEKLAPDLDILINNAGTFRKELELTEDGFETTFAVNHLAPFLLTHKLLPILKSRPSARIINVSSAAHNKANLNFDNLKGEKGFDGYEIYAVTKLCNILFTRCLAAICKNTNVSVNALHPGVIETKLLRAGFNIRGEGVDKGSETSFYLATAPQVESTTGAYFLNSKLSFPSRLAQDDNLAVKLWKKSEEMLKPWM